MWSVVSLVMAVAAIVGVFVYIPMISEYAFWVLAAAIIFWLGAHALRVAVSLAAMLSVALLLLAIMSVFVEIPVVSDFAFWVLVIAFLIEVGITAG
jgi:hypothetical protein